MTRICIIFILVLFIFFSCRKNVYEPKINDIGHLYFPVKLGQIFIYKADSFKLGYQGVPKEGLKTNFFIKEQVIYKFGDSNKTVYTFARYHSNDTLKWNFIKYHFYEVEKFRVIHKEDNILTTVLVFPVAKNYYWNGNEFNNLDYQEFEYSILGFDFIIFDKIFQNSLKVRMDSTVNSVQNHTKFEIFCKDKGLIYSENSFFDIPANDTIGIRFTKSLIRFSN